MNINMNAIMGKARAWSESPDGKRRMKDVIEKYSKEGRDTTAAGGKLFNEKSMWEAAVKFIDVMKSTARSYNLPASVMEHIDGMSSGSIIKTQNGYELPLYFFGDLHRESLEADEESVDYWSSRGFGRHTGPGIDNIVALFNNGYDDSREPIKTVYGLWASTGQFVHNKQEREALRFIQQAVMDFNSNYGAEYNVTAVPSAAYE